MKKAELVVIAAYIVGIALIITGQSVYRYAAQRITDLEAQLSPSLSQQEYWNIQGSLDWWRPALTSLIWTYLNLSHICWNRHFGIFDCVYCFQNLAKQINISAR
jgi:hypothetical protein